MVRLGYLALVSVLMTCLTGTATARGVVSAEYRLGDTAFQTGGFTNELTASVHYPADVTRGTHPLVVMLHGWFATCADREAGDAYTNAWEQLNGRDPVQDPAERDRLRQVMDDAYPKLHRWPCAPGVEPVPSYRGYDYLGRKLAGEGFVVVSISANGINSGGGGNEIDARAALINEHLRMWQQLSATGSGPLAARFAPLAGHVDLTRVGVMGHSKGGRGVVRHAADGYHQEWPAGVRVRAVVALEPIISGGEVITEVPFLNVIGACDLVSNPLARRYFEDAAGKNKQGLHQLTVHGANHSFFNTQWSPSSGQVMAGDDAYDHARPPYPAPGNCRTTDDTQVEQKQLSERDQRLMGEGYLAAFFGRYLSGDTRFDPTLTGQEHPLAHVGQVDVEAEAPTGSA